MNDKVVAAALAEQGFELDSKVVRLDAPIREIGNYEVRIHLHSDVEVFLPVKVRAEGFEDWEPGQPLKKKAEGEGEARRADARKSSRSHSLGPGEGTVEDKLENVVPPQDLDAEMSVIGAALLDNEVISDLAGVLEAGGLLQAAHRTLYDVIVKQFRAGRRWTSSRSPSALAREGLMEEIGGKPYLASIFQTIPSTAHVESARERSSASARSGAG